MINLSEQYHEQFHHIQQQFNQWKPFEQLYAIVELSRKLQIYHRHYLSQYLQNEILHENDEIFNLTVDEANTPKMVACRHSMPIEKILKILQLHLSLISNKQFTVELFDAYRDILLHLDSKLTQSNTSLCSTTTTHQQIYSSAQQIFFFLQTNPHLKCLICQLPNLIYLIQTKSFASNSPTDSEKTSTTMTNQSKLLAHSSVIPTTRNHSKLVECASVIPITPLMHQDVHDSGVDLSEVGMHNYLKPHHSYSYSTRNSTKNRHILVGETVSAPIPEQMPAHQPLIAVMSAPPSNMYSDYPSYRSARMRPTLTKSDEEEEETNESNQHHGTTDHSNRTNDSPVDQSLTQQSQEPTRLVRQYYSLRERSAKTTLQTEDVSQYLDVDGNGIPSQNTFLLPNTGMKDVPRWLKTLRLHKYDVFFSKMTYDEMMDLTMEKLKELRITEGACSKIMVHIKKLKDRSITLQKTIIDFDKGEIDLAKFIQHLNDLISTPIRAKPVDSHDENDDLPKAILEALEIAMNKLNPSASPELANQLLGLFDRCYRHEAFTVPQRHSILQWRGRLFTSIQCLGRFEFRSVQAASNPSLQNQRRINKIPSRNLRNYSSVVSVPVSSAYTSDVPHSILSMTNSNPIRRPDRSQRLIPSPSDNISSTSRLSGTTGTYSLTHQHQPLVRKPSVHSYSDSHQNKTRLCKTMSDPHQMGIFTPIQSMNNNSTVYHRMLAPTYSQQHQILSNKTSIEKENHENDSSANAYEEQQSNSTETDPFLHQITEKAMSDDVVSH